MYTVNRSLEGRKLEESWEKGWKEGQEKGMEGMAKSLLESGISPDIIARSSGLPVERILTLKDI
jgi:hypothetical protein